MTPARLGALVVLASAACFAFLPILVKYAYADGVPIRQLIAIRFIVAAIGLWCLAGMTRQAPWRVPRRSLLVLGVMGLTLYSLQAFSFIYAVRTNPASLVSLILYTYPALVALGAWLVFGRRLTAPNAAALVATFIGVGLLVGGIGNISLQPSLLFAFLSPVFYTVYILLGDFAMRGARPVAAAAVVMTGSAITFAIIAAAGGELKPPPSIHAAGILLLLALVPTVAAISLFLAALPLIGAGRAALLSTLEPVVTIALAAVLFGERLSPVQVAGGVLVLAAVVALQWSRRSEPAPAAR